MPSKIQINIGMPSRYNINLANKFILFCCQIATALHYESNWLTISNVPSVGSRIKNSSRQSTLHIQIHTQTLAHRLSMYFSGEIFSSLFIYRVRARFHRTKPEIDLIKMYSVDCTVVVVKRKQRQRQHRYGFPFTLNISR